MPRMYCMGTSVDIPENGKICPRLPTNMVPSGTKCEIVCDSGTPSVEFIKCEVDGWSIKEVGCSVTSTGLIVGLLVGGFIVVCILAYLYARMKMKKKQKLQGKNAKNQPVSRAAKIAARNDMMVTGVVTRDAVKAGIAPQQPRKSQGKLVTGSPEGNEYRHPSSSSQNMSSPPSYQSNDLNDETRSGKSRRSRNSSTDQQPTQHQHPRKHRSYYDEYTEEVDLGYHEDTPAAVMDGQFHSIQNTGPMYPDYYGPGSAPPHQHGYSAMDHNYYRQEVGAYPDRYLDTGVDNTAYAPHHQKPYHLPV
ncbi:uncharacterized protein LOC120339113 [Styela clava]|uniref:uncharacterized protein LOC120339113 n=1 Tax=Styela clava TaxID=7725 RepID=UPI001939BC82|nr:uncharacterized protein LOC120339113 [Styela clava]